MIDLDLLLRHTDEVVRRLTDKNVDESLVLSARDALIARRTVNSLLDDKRAEMNRRSKQFRTVVRDGGPAAEQERKALSNLKAEIAVLEDDFRQSVRRADELLYQLPNLPHPEAPKGVDESANVVLRHSAIEALQTPGARPHWEIADELGLWDPKRASKISGSGFPILYGDGARLLRALLAFATDLHRNKYLESVVPTFVRSETALATGHLPKFANDMYATADPLWAVPTGEMPLTGLHRDEIIEVDELPRRYMAYTPCFRREAGSAGKDTRGMQRLHEFHKVELVTVSAVDRLEAEFADMLADAERALQLLELPYRVVDLCTGDLTFASCRIFDLEVYAPGLNKWLEVSSVGNFSDFQSRRANMRVRNRDGSIGPVGTLNASAIATPRVWAALLEHGQRGDGSVRIPDALVPYFGGESLGRSPLAPVALKDGQV